MSGWVRFAISGDNASAENCAYLEAGAYEDGPSHDRNDIPESLTLAAMESRLLDSDRYPELTTGQAYLGDSTTMHDTVRRSEEHTSELQSRRNLVCRLLLEKKNTMIPLWAPMPYI